jgi:hypothetical protein
MRSDGDEVLVHQLSEIVQEVDDHLALCLDFFLSEGSDHRETEDVGTGSRHGGRLWEGGILERSHGSERVAGDEDHDESGVCH